MADLIAAVVHLPPIAGSPSLSPKSPSRAGSVGEDSPKRPKRRKKSPGNLYADYCQAGSTVGNFFQRGRDSKIAQYGIQSPSPEPKDGLTKVSRRRLLRVQD